MYTAQLYKLGLLKISEETSASQPVKPDDHSEAVPLLPIPNRTVKCLSADDSAGSRVKVGHRQANIYAKRPVTWPGVSVSECVVCAKQVAQVFRCKRGRRRPAFASADLPGQGLVDAGQKLQADENRMQ